MTSSFLPYICCSIIVELTARETLKLAITNTKNNVNLHKTLTTNLASCCKLLKPATIHYDQVENIPGVDIFQLDVSAKANLKNVLV